MSRGLMIAADCTVLLALIPLAGLTAPRPATAGAYNYPYCTSGAGQEYGAVNCGFTTFEQCLAAARGNGQSCGPNPFYVPPTGSVGSKHRQHRPKASR